ncbi:putative aldehyde dehydrogenase family 16 member A1 [Apostichopus japonicus]|uniref:Putative aldehyde dehydrogenase family 16 member A1 n=1 Tax=Stichopus japonicus TaxID=307972 RepID=A0A2G8KBG0_STIJA|nr:putative aldehyde dehydrogenase family 16 member A1 [Apostichopus japonicus]
MAASTATSNSQNSDNSVAAIFDSMQYGPNPEMSQTAQAWFDKHGGNLGHFINNQWVKPEGRKLYTTRAPCTGEVLATTIQGEDEDIELAMKSARKAFDSWSKLPCHVRARHLYSVARHVQKHQRLLSVVESLDNGKPIRETRDADVPLVVRHFYHHAGWAELMDTEMKDWKPIGVIGGIVPWNFPLMLLTWKVCPALAMGNTMVLKPATYTRLSALLLAQICAEAGLPPGVFNVVTGNGAFGSKMAAHPDVDKIAFTGSTEVGQILRRSLAGTGKKLSLELGGKSPFVVFDSADIDSTVEGVVDAIWFNQGQVCSAGSRLIVQENILSTVVDKLRDRISHLRLGHSLDKSIDMGAIVDPSQRKTVDEYVEDARKEGAEVYQNWDCVPQQGCYYPPTIITNVQTSSRVVMEEIFGPVLVVLPFRTAKEAVALGNNTNYGLAASVWTENVSLALEVALSLKAGLYEYVMPKWMSKPRPAAMEMDYKKFGSHVPSMPTETESEVNLVEVNGSKYPSIDRTYKNYYGGSQKRPDGNYSMPVIGANGQVIALVSDSNRKDVRNAVEAAHKAAPGWGKRAAHNRAQIVYYMAENLEQRRKEVAESLNKLTGRDMESCLNEVDLSIQRLFHWGAYADKYGGTVQETMLYGATVKIHEPVGVIAITCPDESPLLGFVSLFAPAVIRGNAVVVVPSEKYPLLAAGFYQVFDTSDLPGGVVNILTGNKEHLTKYLSEHHDVQAMWYFGTAEGSKFVEWTSATNLKRTWVDYGISRDWTNREQGQGEEFLYHAIQVKNVWIPMGDIFAN